jgi:predicted transcriptional regulator
VDWKKYGIIISSDYRKKVLESIAESPKTPKQIANETNLYLSHVSKTLNELVSQGVAICLTPTLKRGRLYELTRDGKELQKYMAKMLHT